jgi:hypothetical protein
MNQSRTLPLILVCAVLLATPVWSQDGELQASRLYQSGRTAFSAQRWDAARLSFEASYRLWQHSLTAYSLSLTYAHLDRTGDALDFAQRALRGNPPLDSRYRGGANWLIGRVRGGNVPIYVESVDGKMDTYTAPVPLEESLIGSIPTDRPEAGSYAILARHSGLCLTTSVDDGNRGNLVQVECGNGANQYFTLRPVDDGGLYMLIDYNNMCVDVTGESQEDGAVITQYPCHGGGNQIFRVQPSGSSFAIVAAHSGKCLDVAGGARVSNAPVTQYRCSSGTNQQWILRRSQ